MTAAMERIQQPQELFASRLRRLLNAHTRYGLGVEELLEAEELIRYPEFSREQCWLCANLNNDDLAIFDTGLCQHHALERIQG